MKKTKEIIGLLLAVFALCVTSAFFLPTAQRVYAAENFTEFAGGDGTAHNPYKVSTPEQLDNVRKYPGAYYIQTQDIDMTEATAEGGVFYNNGAGWEPIGADSSTSFKGAYDGGNHRIIGLKSNREDKYAGLFGYNSGNIKNLGVDGGAVSSSCSYSDSYAGGIAGYNYRGSISNCYNTGAVSSPSTHSSLSSYAGGIAGYNYGGSISNCYNTGAVPSTSSDYAGGIAGYNNGGSISNCYNTGAVSSRSTSSYAGGIAGYNDDGGSIENCYNTGAVSSSDYAGGIAGYNNGGSISNCYNTGAVSSSDSPAGGIAGDNSGGSISNCYNTGAVSSRSTSSSSYAGGIKGNNYGSISNCYYLIARNLRTNGGTPLTLEEMRVQKSYAGFDFDAVWSISPNQNNGYPTLRGMPAPGEARSSICITEKSYGSATGTYHLTVTVHNQGISR